MTLLHACFAPLVCMDLILNLHIYSTPRPHQSDGTLHVGPTMDRRPIRSQSCRVKSCPCVRLRPHDTRGRWCRSGCAAGRSRRSRARAARPTFRCRTWRASSRLGAIARSVLWSAGGCEARDPLQTYQERAARARFEPGKPSPSPPGAVVKVPRGTFSRLIRFLPTRKMETQA